MRGASLLETVNTTGRRCENNSRRRFADGAGPQRTAGLVGADDDARGPGLRTDKREFAWRDCIRKETFASAQQDRIDEQQDFVSKPVFEQHWRQRRAAPEDQVRPVLLLNAANAFDDVRSKAL